MSSSDPSSRDRRRLLLWSAVALAGVAGAAYGTWHVLLRVPEPDEVCEALRRSAERRSRLPSWSLDASDADHYRSVCTEALARHRPDTLPLWSEGGQNPHSYVEFASCVDSARNDKRVDECFRGYIGRVLVDEWMDARAASLPPPEPPPEPPPPLTAEPIEVVDVPLLDAPYYARQPLRPSRTLVTGTSLKLAPVPDLPAGRALVQLEEAPWDQMRTVLYDTRTGEELARFGRVVLVQREQGIAEIREQGTGRVGILELSTDRIVYPEPTLPDGTKPDELRLALFGGPVTWGVLFGRSEGGPTSHAIWELRDDPPAVLAEEFPYWPRARDKVGTFEIDRARGERGPSECNTVYFTPDKTLACDGRHFSLVDGTAVYPGGRIGRSQEEARCLVDCRGARDLNVRDDSNEWFPGNRFIKTVEDLDSGATTLYFWAPDRVVSWERDRDASFFGTSIPGGLVNPSHQTPPVTEEWIDLINMRILHTEPLLPVAWRSAGAERMLVTRMGKADPMMMLDAERAVLEPVAPDLDCPELRPLESTNRFAAFRCDRRSNVLLWSLLVDFERQRAVRTTFATELALDGEGCVVAANARKVVVGCPEGGSP